MLSRRALFGLPLLGVGAAVGTGGWSLAEAAVIAPRVTRYDLQPPGWPAGLTMTFSIIADLHACDPWMNRDRITEIVAATQALQADAVLLLGDYVIAHGHFMEPVPPQDWAGPLATLRAPLGVHAILGNHDWWADAEVQASRTGLPAAAAALQGAGIVVLQNSRVALRKDGCVVHLAGLGDQEAFNLSDEPSERFGGVDDLDATLAGVPDGEAVILLAHEPDIFPHVPKRVSLTLSGHTHGGQVRVLGHAPLVPSRYGDRYAYGHVVEDGRHLVVSGGLGCSILPVRLGVPPEIVMLRLSSPAAS